MMSCILAFYLVHFSGPIQPGPQSADPDALYVSREDLGKAREAANLWAERLQKNPKDFESAWKLAKARDWLGTHAPDAERKVLLESGIAAGQAASALEPQ